MSGSVDGVKPVLLFQLQEAEALVQVALHGAQVDAEHRNQGFRVDPLALVEAAQDFDEACQGFLSAGFPV